MPLRFRDSCTESPLRPSSPTFCTTPILPSPDSESRFAPPVRRSALPNCTLTFPLAESSPSYWRSARTSVFRLEMVLPILVTWLLMFSTFSVISCVAALPAPEGMVVVVVPDLSVMVMVVSPVFSSVETLATGENPSWPRGPVKPGRPGIPCGPSGPAGPGAPVSPLSPLSPLSPFSPRIPGAPVMPICPWSPLSPFSPFRSGSLWI